MATTPYDATQPAPAVPVDPNAGTTTAATGLINTPVAMGAASLQTPGGTQTTPANWNVQPNQTVASQVKGIIDDNSPLMQQAQTRALQQANSRGLMNSSLAVGAGQDAVIAAATPIATADAATYARAGETNAGYQQQAGLANQNASNQVSAQNSQLATSTSMGNAAEANKINQIDAQQKGDLARIAASGEVQQKLAAFSASAAKDLANIEAQYKGLTQASSSAASVMTTTTAAIARIMEDTSLDAAGKQKAIDTYNTNAKISLSIIGSLAGNVELGHFMDSVLA
jgi:hypothetical protein